MEKEIYNENLFEKILIEPTSEGADSLYIVSGYATSAMAFHHLNHLRNKNSNIKIDLLIGMCPLDGIASSNHRGFQNLMENEFPSHFSCSYLTRIPPAHSKIYIWLNNENPYLSYIGSANYTQTAFIRGQREILTECSPKKAFIYYEKLLSESIFCNHHEAENFVKIFNDKFFIRKKKAREIFQDIPGVLELDYNTMGLQYVEVSLLDNYGNLPERSGLNWGQRPEEKREPNQAYIRLSSKIYKSDFFPPRGVHFTILTDDSKVLICSRAQENGKAIHTPHNNSLIGEYFRNRLGVNFGVPVKKDDLLKYGRNTVLFYKIDDETYLMDFSHK